jgi:DNA-binding IclR family transcriptional regulator
MGFLRRDPSSRRYLMGFKTFEVGSLAGRLTNRMAWSRPELRKLARKLKATVSLRLVVDDDLLVVDMIESLTHLPIHIPQGARVPLNYGAGGQVMAAFRADEDSRRLIRKYGLPRFTAKSLTTEKEFFSAVRRVRAHGYAVSEGETRPGYFSVAAPILGADNLLTAVLVVSSPVGAMTRKEISAFAEVTAETARRLTRRCHEM